MDARLTGRTRADLAGPAQSRGAAAVSSFTEVFRASPALRRQTSAENIDPRRGWMGKRREGEREAEG